MNALAYAQELIRRASPSRTSNAEVSQYARSVLEQLGFEIEWIEYRDADGVLKVNVLGKKGTGPGGATFFGHTDTVPADDWALDDPFEPVVQDGKLFGRGACDMKGPVACVLEAAGRFTLADLARPLYVVCTADEEVGYTGARVVAERSRLYGEIRKSQGIVAEPTGLHVVYAHKGTVAIRAVAHGRAAHSSTREGFNANLKMIPFLAELKRIHDELQSDPRHRNDEFDPPTAGWNIGINDGNGVLNVTSARSEATVYYRPMPRQDIEPVLQRVRRAADREGLELDIRRTGEPLYTPPDSPLVRTVLEVAGRSKPRTVPYGTDAMVFGQHVPVVVFGPGDVAQAHTIDEWIALEQLQQAVELNSRLIEKFCC